MDGVAERVRRAKALIFDFDGTLVDSNPIKWKAFERCFRAFPDRLPEIMTYCRGNNHTTRTEKFWWVYKGILRLPYTEEVEKRLCRVFEESSTDPIIEAPEIPGASAFLRTHAGGHALLGVLSSTPHRILTDILSRRGWLPCFRIVRGAPVNKAEFLRATARETGLRPREGLFFGDTPEDAFAAQEAGWSFVAVRSKELAHRGVPFLPDFRTFSRQERSPTP